MSTIADKDPSTTDAEGAKNLSAGGKVPKQRIGSYDDAVAIVKRMIEEDGADRFDRQNEQALFDGEGPYLQEDLDRTGQGWRRNNNYGGALAQFERAQAPYNELLNGFTVELAPEITTSQREEWQAIIAEGFLHLHTRIWKNHYFENLNLQRLFVGFGIGVAEHEHTRDFRWRAGGLGEHFFPRPIQAYEDAANIHVRVREYRLDELWEWHDSPKAEGVGFNKEQVEIAMRACNASGGNDTSFVGSLSNNVYGQTYAKSASVKLFTLRVREMAEDGTDIVSTCIGMLDREGKDFIYRSKRPEWTQKMSDSFTLFAAGIGNGELHSIKGLGHKIFNTAQTENQFINLMYDFALIFMSPMFKSDSATAAKDLQAMQIGIFNLIPKGLELIPASAAPNYSQSILPLLGFSAQLGQNATGVYQPTTTPAQVEQTREEVMQRTRENAVITSAAITLYTRAKENQYNTTLKRLVNPKYGPGDPGYEMRQEFIAYCTRRGVPREVVMKAAYVTPNRAVGGGSAGLRQALLEKAGALRPYLDPVSQKLLDKMMLTGLLGSDTAKELVPTLGIQRTSVQQRFAMDENCWFENGTPRPVLPDDDHFVHAKVHDAALPDVYNKYAQQAMKDEQMLAFLNCFIQHQRAHLQAIGDNKPQAGEIGQFNANLNKAVQTQQHLVNAAQAEQNRLAQLAQAQAQKQAAGTPPSGIDAGGLEQTAAKANLDMSIAAREAQQKLAQSDETHRQRLAHADQTTRAKIAAQDALRASELLDSARPQPPK